MEQTTTKTTKSKSERVERVVEQTISVFRIGYMLSFLLVGIGLVVALIRDIPLATELGPPRELFDHLIDLDPNGFIGLGIAVLILTPVVMTAEVTINFFREGDQRYTMIAGIVTLILTVTLALAFI